MTHTLPIPDEDALQHSQALVDIIALQGELSFARFMEMALYQPGLGYYSAGSRKFGASGDFVTAPEISPLFAHCLARQCEQVLKKIPQGQIVEFGAGTGKLAAQLLQQIPENLLQTYYIVEVSPDLQQRQQQTLAEQCPKLLAKVQWLSRLDNLTVHGVIIANEVMDAFPVEGFTIKNQQIYRHWVRWQHNAFQLQLRFSEDESFNQLIKQRLPELPDYQSEINLQIRPWIKSLSQLLHQGIILLIDYGFLRSEYYHPQRSMGTLMCHYRHRAHPDPFLYPGLQDITAHVDFTEVGEAALENDCQVSGYSNQAQFLMSCGILQIAQQIPTEDNIAQLKMSQQLQLLLMPHEMGELFKVMALSRNFADDLIGFQENK